jgi:apolipoprotein N-acyltransferase
MSGPQAARADVDGRETTVRPADRLWRALLAGGEVESTGVIVRHRVLVGLAVVTVLLKSLIFAPIAIWPLAFVCLAPWLVMVGGSLHAKRVYLYSFLMAVVFFLLNMRWMYPATGVGYVALSIYQALYFPLLACPIRHGVRRRGWPMAIVFPLIWTAGELLRAVVMSGFPWFFLSHSLYRVLTLIQVSDLVGAYGASFVVAAVNGAIADLIFARIKPSPEPGWGPRPMAYERRAKIGVPFAVIAVMALIVYGQVQLRRGTMSEGPKVAILQGDFAMTVDTDEVPDTKKREIYFAMLDEAAQAKPDLIALPETPWRMYLNRESRDFYPLSRNTFTNLRDRAMRFAAYIVTGSGSLEQTPLYLLTKEKWFNSAMVFAPDGSEPARYDKVHLVYFGEIVPFRFGRLRFIYFWLNSIMPFSNGGKQEYSLFPGSGFHAVEMKPTSQPGQRYQFGIPICYEDVMPYVAREFVGGCNEKGADFLLNISNDGWFGRGMQQPQHLATCVFRAVENRVGIARAVNTGVSAFIDPNGAVHDRVTGDAKGRWPNQCGYSVANIVVDSRYTLYSRFGDWFGWTCALFLLLFYVDYWIARARSRSEE